MCPCQSGKAKPKESRASASISNRKQRPNGQPGSSFVRPTCPHPGCREPVRPFTLGEDSANNVHLREIP